MADVHDKETRSYNMSRIKGKDTKPEMLVRRFLHANGYRYRLHVKDMPGKPDIVLPKYRTVVFIHGCFWHGHQGCKYYVVPKTRTEWWLNKIKGNQMNDAIFQQRIRSDGWKVIEIFECELRRDKFEYTMSRLIESIESK